MSAFVVVNPHSANKRTMREWPAIDRLLRTAYPGMNVAFTKARGDATTMVREALHEGHHEVIAIGGDGTISEAVNGFFDERGPVAPDAVFGFVTSGTGGDFRKSFGIEAGTAAAIERLQKAPVRAMDVGKLSCLTTQGLPAVRYFTNIASFGLSGVIVESVNRSRVAKLLGGKFAFAFHSLKAALTYSDHAVRIHTDDGLDEIARIATVAIANGQYFGGGMRVAPDAATDDGVFDVVIMGGSPKHKALSDMKLLYTGEHVNLPNVRVIRTRKLVAAPVAETRGRPVYIEADGENVGKLPATFEVLPRALNLRC